MRSLAVCSVLGLFGLLACSSTPRSTPTPDNIDDVAYKDSEDVSDASDDGFDSYGYQQECIGYEFWFCPPLGAIWQKQVIIDKCAEVDCEVELCTASGYLILSIGECTEVLECNPHFPDLGTQICETEEGYPGEQKVVCEKGRIWFGPCVPCHEEEVCNGEDDDCDGQTDEGGDWGDCASDCGSGPLVCFNGSLICTAPEPQEEMCNYVDDDCDGLTDEGQKNQCGECGLVPEETCDGVDNDCDGETDEDLFELCSTPCGTGYRQCVEDGSGVWTMCSAKQPAPETCNSIDDDCDGEIDEDLLCGCLEHQVGALFPCKEDPLVCGKGWQQCQCAGGSTITPCPGVTVISECHALCYFQPIEGEPCLDLLGEPTPEECNNFDDDCDYLIDEDLYGICYSGPEGTMGVGTCHGGQQTCVKGEWGGGDPFQAGVCSGEVLPLAKDSCNGLDEDCDGLVDDGEKMKPTDICFVVDWSGSMAEEIAAVMGAMAQFAKNYSDEEILQWCLVVGPHPNPETGTQNGHLRRVIDLSPFSDFQAALTSLDPGSIGGADEMLLDALWLMLGGETSGLEWAPVILESVPPHDEFSIQWRGGDIQKLIIVWSDEDPQSHMIPKISNGDVKELIKSTPNLKVFTFTPTQLNIKNQWEPMAVESGGQWFELTTLASEMFLSLTEILDEEVCQ